MFLSASQMIYNLKKKLSWHIRAQELPIHNTHALCIAGIHILNTFKDWMFHKVFIFAPCKMVFPKETR